MTSPRPTDGKAAAERVPRDSLGLIAIILASIVYTPALVVFLIGLIPDLNLIWWTGILIIPLLAVVGVIVLILAVIGIVIGVRRHGRYILSIIGVVLGVLAIAPIGAVVLH